HMCVLAYSARQAGDLCRTAQESDDQPDRRALEGRDQVRGPCPDGRLRRHRRRSPVRQGPEPGVTRGRSECKTADGGSGTMTLAYQRHAAVEQDVEPGDAVHPGDPVRVDRYTKPARINHWITAPSLVLLALSGLALFHPSLYFLPGLFGGGRMTRIIHPWIGVV